MHRNKHIDVVINDTDKNACPACADKEDAIKESKRQLYEKWVYKHTLKGVCSNKEAAFLLSNLNKFKIPHFYIIWKILKNPILGSPIEAGYNWILTPASIFVGHYRKDFCKKFDSILLDILSLLKILEKE